MYIINDNDHDDLRPKKSHHFYFTANTCLQNISLFEHSNMRRCAIVTNESVIYLCLQKIDDHVNNDCPRTVGVFLRNCQVDAY